MRLFSQSWMQAWIATLLPQMQDAIKRGEFPGGVLCVGRKSGKPWIRNVGNRQVMPHVVEGTTDTIYDLASLTKPLVTSTLILKLHEEGKLDIDQPVAKYLRDFAVHGKDHITLRQLLLHTSGLIADNALTDYETSHETAIENLLAFKPIRPADECFVYSDVGYLVLGQVIEQVTGKTLDAASRELLFEPLGMQQTMYNPEQDTARNHRPARQTRRSLAPGRRSRPSRRGARRGGGACRSFFLGRRFGALCRR